MSTAHPYALPYADLTTDGAMTDPKGDRSKAPHEQADPDLFLRVVERRPDGIVFRGAKAHQTGIINSHEVLVMPTISMGEKDADYAVAFSVPVDTKGIYMIIGRQSCDTRKLENTTSTANMNLPGCSWNASPAITGSPTAAARCAWATWPPWATAPNPCTAPVHRRPSGS